MIRTGFFAAGAMSAIVAFAANAASIDDAKAQQLLKSGGCFACHAVDKKVIGPSYKDVAARHKGEKDAVASLEKSVRGGSKGAYGGAMPMPPNPASKISDADLHELAEWIVAQ